MFYTAEDIVDKKEIFRRRGHKDRSGIYWRKASNKRVKSLLLKLSRGTVNGRAFYNAMRVIDGWILMVRYTRGTDHLGKKFEFPDLTAVPIGTEFKTIKQKPGYKRKKKARKY